jgi:hypothetical protein
MGAHFRLVFDAQGDLRRAAHECEIEVFRDKYGIDPGRMSDEYAPYDASSVWLAVVRNGTDVVGSSRIVVPGAPGFKSLADVSGDPWNVDGVSATAAARLDLSRTWDVATLSRRHEFRDVPVTEALAYGIVRGLLLNGATGTIAVLDSTVRVLLQRKFGLRYSAIPGTTRKFFMGSPSEPVMAHVPTMLDDARRRRPEGYRVVTVGAGLGDIDLPTTAEHLVPPRVLDLRKPAQAVGPSAVGRRPG